MKTKDHQALSWTAPYTPLWFVLDKAAVTHLLALGVHSQCGLCTINADICLELIRNAIFWVLRIHSCILNTQSLEDSCFSLQGTGLEISAMSDVRCQGRLFFRTYWGEGVPNIYTKFCGYTRAALKTRSLPSMSDGDVPSSPFSRRKSRES